MTCLDTDVLIDLAGRAHSEVGRKARQAVGQRVRAGELLATTRMNVAELLVGVYRSTDPARERERVGTLLGPLSILEFDARAAEAVGRVTGFMQERGTPIGDMDALIAAVCVSGGHRLLTRNVRHFAGIPGLVVEGY